MVKKNTVVAILATLCLTSTLFMILPIQSQSGVGEYDPWTDLNGDGEIDIFDIVQVAIAFGSSGTPIKKASIEYDSGWINITSRQGQYITVTHGLNITDWNDENIDVSIMGKASPDGEILRNLGLTGPAQGWNRTYGGTSNDYAHALVQAADGGYALAGRTTSFGAGSDDFWLVKTDASGNEQWNKTYGGTNDESAYDLVQTSDGGYAIAGLTTSFGAGSDDFWLVKTDASGNEQWNKTYGGTYYDVVNGLVQTGDGGYALAGRTSSFGAGSYEAWLVRTDPSGNEQWNKTYGGTYYDLLNGLVQTGDGGYALAGYTNSFGAGLDDAWLIKTDAAGNALDGFKWYGLAWVGSTPDTIKLYRGTDDEYWNYVRIRIWKPKTP